MKKHFLKIGFISILSVILFASRSYAYADCDYSQFASFDIGSQYTISMPFTAGETANITSATIYARSVGSPTGTLLFQLSADTNQDGIPDGLELEHASIDVSTISSSFGTITFNGMLYGIELTSGEHYVALITYESGDIDNHVDVALSTGSSGNYYAGVSWLPLPKNMPFTLNGSLGSIACDTGGVIPSPTTPPQHFGTTPSGSAVNSSILGASTTAVGQAGYIVPVGVGVLGTTTIVMWAVRRFTLLASLRK